MLSTGAEIPLEVGFASSNPEPEEEEVSSMSVGSGTTVLATGAGIPPEVGFASPSFPFPSPVVDK